MDLTKLNPQIQKLIEETGTAIRNERDLQALSNVSVRELARLFDEIARNLSSKQPKGKKEVFDAWKDKVVQQFSEKIEKDPNVVSDTPSTASALELEIDPECNVLSDEELKQVHEDIRKYENEIKQTELLIVKAKEEARLALKLGDDKKLAEASKTLHDLRKKNRDALAAADNKRDKSFYKTVFMKKAKKSGLQIKSAPKNSSIPEQITSIDSPVTVDVTKHTFDDQFVFQFDVQTKDNTQIEDVRIEMPEELDGLKKIYHDKDETKPDSVYVSYQRLNPDEIVNTSVAPILRYKEKDLKTGVVKEVEQQLEPVHLSALDFVQDSKAEGGSVDDKWNALAKNETKVVIKLNPSDGLDNVLTNIAKATGLPGFSDAVLNNREARRILSVHEFAKTKKGKKPLLVKSDLKELSDDEVEAVITLRSEDPEVRELVAEAIREAVDDFTEKQRERERDQAHKLRQQELRDSSPQLSKLDTPAKTSEVIELSRIGDVNVDVEVVKHVYRDTVVFQFMCVNKEPNKLLKNATVVQNLEKVVGLAPEFTLSADLPYNKEMSIHTAFKRINQPDFPTGTISNILEFTIVENNTKRPGQLPLQDIDIGTLDFIKPKRVANFDQEWDDLGGSSEKKVSGAVPSASNIQNAIDKVMSSTKLAPNNSTQVPPDAKRHEVKLSGQTVDGDKILTKLDASSANNVPQLSVTTRSNNKNIPANLSGEILQQVDKEEQRKADKKNEAELFEFEKAFGNLGQQNESDTQLAIPSTPLQTAVNNFISNLELLPVGGTEVVTDDKQHVLKLKDENNNVLVEARFDATDPERINIDVAVRSNEVPTRNGKIRDIIKKYEDIALQQKNAQRAKDAFEKDLSQSPALKDKGIPFATSEPLILTDSDDDLEVKLTKHTYADSFVLQYDILNKNQEMVIENISAEHVVDALTGAKKINEIPTGALKDNKAILYSVFGDFDANSLPDGMIGTILNIQSGGNEYEMKIEDFLLNPVDFVKDTKLNFQQEWDKLTASKEGKARNVYENRKDLQPIVDKLVENSHLSPKFGTGVVVDEDKHSVQLTGKLPDGESVVVDVTLAKLDSSVTVDVACRSTNKSARDAVPKGVLQELKFKMKELLKFEEDMENPYFRDVFSKIPALKKLGAPHSSRKAILVSRQSELEVKVLKHTFQENIVLQFECTSKRDDVELENVMVESEFDESEHLSKQFFVQAGLLTYNLPDFVFMALEKDRNAFPESIIRNTLSFDKVKINPVTGDHTGEVIQDVTVELEPVEVRMTDYFSAISNIDFDATWDSLSSSENVKTFSLSKKVQDSVDYVIDRVGFEPNIRDGNTLKYAAFLHNGSEVLFEVSFNASGSNTSVTIAARSEEEYLLNTPDFILA